MASIHKTDEGLNAAGLINKRIMRKLPGFKSDLEVEKFLDRDLSDYISGENFAPFQFEFRPKLKSVNLPRSGKGRARRPGK